MAGRPDGEHLDGRHHAAIEPVGDLPVATLDPDQYHGRRERDRQSQTHDPMRPLVDEESTDDATTCSPQQRRRDDDDHHREGHDDAADEVGEIGWPKRRDCAQAKIQAFGLMAWKVAAWTNPRGRAIDPRLSALAPAIW